MDPLRRCDIQRMTAIELAIRDVIYQVESVGAGPSLTEAVILLGKAQDAFADYIDTNPRPAGCVCPLGAEWHHPLTGHCGDCGCFACSAER